MIHRVSHWHSQSFLCYVDGASGGTVPLDNLGTMCLFRVSVYLSSLPYDGLIPSFGHWRATLLPGLGEQLILASFTIYRKKFKNLLGRCFSMCSRCSSHQKVTESLTKYESRSQGHAIASRFTTVKIHVLSHSSGPLALDKTTVISCSLQPFTSVKRLLFFFFSLRQNRSSGKSSFTILFKSRLIRQEHEEWYLFIHTAKENII